MLMIVLFPGMLSAQNTMNLVYFNNFPPLSWEDENKQMCGILADALTEAIQTRMKIQVSHKGYPWERAQQMVKRGEADAFITLPTPERRSYTEVSSETVLLVTFTLFVKSDSPKTESLKKVKTVADLKGFRIGSYIGSGWGKKNLINAGMDVDLAGTMDLCLKKLIGGRFDVFTDVSQSVRYRIRELDLKDKIVELPNIIDSGEFQLCVGKKSPFVNILPKYDEIVREMRNDGTLQKIYDKYR
jgi:polar amino acid transport system substrate-binding protein